MRLIESATFSEIRGWLLLPVMAAAFPIGSPASGAAVTYSNITAIKARQLTNGEQITVQSDGVLEFEQLGEGGVRFRGDSGQKSSMITLLFPGARSALTSNFINVGEYPVSYVQVQIPQNAPNGVGVKMTVALFTAASFSVVQSPDQQSVIITVNSERTIALNRTGPAGAAVAGAGETSTTMEMGADNHVHVQAVGADIHELLAKLAHLTGINIAVDDRVNRKISLSLDGMTADEVIHAIASGYGLALSQFNGVYMVSEGVPTDLATYHLSGTQSFRMNYLQAQQASGLLPTFLFQYLHVNAGQNAVVVTAPTQMLAKIGADLQSLDVQPPLIEIDAMAVEFTDTKDAAESLGFTIHRGDRTTSFDTATGNIQYQTVPKPVPAADGTTPAALPYSFAARLTALIQKGKAHIRANPRLAVVNGQSASIFIGDEKFIQVQFNGFGGTQTKIQGVDVGTRLAITPWTGGNGEITAGIHPEVSNISEINLQTGLPILSDRRADTTVRVKDGDTIVIGGLVQKERFVTNGKIPVLGDIPVIGQLFRSHKESTVHSELMIFITPHILDPQGQVPNDTPERKAMENTLLHTMETEGAPAPAAPPVPVPAPAAPPVPVPRP